MAMASGAVGPETPVAMNEMPTGSLRPTWFGHVATARDALILFEACLTGLLHHVPRRPHDRERAQLIRSGCVFIYEENASGIKRWTDGVPWSPSRILGNFLVYRELLKPFAPGEKKRATKKNKRPPRPGDGSSHGGSNDDPISPTSPTVAESPSGIPSREQERSLIGSLVDSYGFREGGLVKKTMSVLVNGVHHHLVSYYRIEDVMNGSLTSPSAHPRLSHVDPRPDLILRQNFRAPLDEQDETVYQEAGHELPPPGYMYAPYGRPPMLVTSPTQLSPSMSMPYSTAGMQSAISYESTPVSPSTPYYPTSPSIASPIKAEGMESYHHYMQPARGHERSNSYVTSPCSPTSPFPYRQNSTGHFPSLASPQQPPREWDRTPSSGQGSFYHPGSPPATVVTPKYSNGHHPWPLSPTTGPNLPPPGSAWHPHDSTWDAPDHHHHGSRTGSYHGQPDGQ